MNENFDLAIIGGGIVGSAAAYYSSLKGITETISNGSQFATNVFVEKDNYKKAGWFHIDLVRKIPAKLKPRRLKIKTSNSNHRISNMAS